MSLLESMANATTVKKISITDIRANSKNFYGLREVKELAVLIKKQGQLENATVYYDTEQNDGMHYTLIGGNRRYKAIEYLMQNNQHDGFIECKIIEKPKDDLEEALLLMTDNAQREKNIAERKQEVLIGLDIYNRDKAMGIIPAGIKGRDYIGQIIGISGRHVQNILKKIKEDEEGSSKKKKEKAPSIEDAEKIIKRVAKQLEKATAIAEQVNQKQYLERISEALNSVQDVIDWFE